MEIERIKKRKKAFTKSNVNKAPITPGSYIFWSKKTKPLYVGKAINLKSRLKSYLSTTLGIKTKRLISKTSYFSYIKVNSELEALLLEASLIKKLKPPYNISAKDDKKPLYIQITDEKYPRVLTVRKEKRYKRSKLFIGPFPSSTNVRGVLKTLRKIFPYSQHRVGKKPCLYSQIGLCDPCPNYIEKQKDSHKRKNSLNKYRKNIRQLKGVLTAKFKKIRKDMVDEMKSLSKAKSYEEAALMRDKIEKLDYITQPVHPVKSFLKNPNLLSDIRIEELKRLRDTLSPFIEFKKIPKRIECYDVSHLSGLAPCASMVTFVKGESKKSLYRNFRIRQKKSQSDTDSLREVAQRRESHLNNWGRPNLIIVDGGRGQVRVFHDVFKDRDIPVVGLSKRPDKLIIPVKSEGGTLTYKTIVPKRGPVLFLIQRLRDEAHRFARRYHHKLLKKRLTSVADQTKDDSDYNKAN
ncbi:MAG: GIY-YIG nuclease family protein [Candidatus Woesebacteria bacterium]|jgi:excinuclease ABC subunit C